MFLLSHFCTFLSAMTCISLTLCKKTLKPSKKYFNSQDKSFEKKLHTPEFQLKGIGGNMRWKLLQKRSLQLPHADMN